MSIAVPLRGVERLISFGGICGVIGVVCDLMEPVGNYTLWALIAGALILLAGLVLATFRSWRDQVVQAISAFGGLLVAISIGFMAMAPEGDRGVLATEIAWVGSAQSELLGLKEVALAIAEDTSQIADNTSQIVDTNTQIAATSEQIAESNSQIADTNSQIATASSQIATDAELVRHLSFSMDGFLTALESKDQINIRAYCERGYRIYHTAFLFRPDRNYRNRDDSNYDLLVEMNCFDTERICDTTDWWGLQKSLDPRRVAEQCGPAGVQRLAQYEADDRQRAIDAARQQEECEAEVKADPTYELWPSLMMARC